MVHVDQKKSSWNIGADMGEQRPKESGAIVHSMSFEG